MTAREVIPWVWITWWVSWWIAALARSRTVARAKGRVGYRVIPVLGAFLVFAPFSQRLSPRLLTWQLPAGAAWTMVGVAVVGFAFTWWARIHLGRLWSSDVTRKEGHRVVDTGPYRLVRHPIYTGLCLAAFATAIIEGSVIAVIGAAILAVGFHYKARVEERFLTTELGENYTEYAKRTPMLVPLKRR
jgi:protein-S-isoprenylcysteine O-methyltransferase Ste14